MKIATFNINGIKARIEAVSAWLSKAQPDVAVLQEIKCTDANFPSGHFEDMGYTVTVHGQKSFNGVALLSKPPLEDVGRGLPSDEGDDQARLIEATVMGTRPVRVVGLYLPNGNPVPGPKYDYKLAWMDRLQARVTELLALEEPLVVCGDYNVIPQTEDAASPDKWRDDALFLPGSRAAFRRLMHLGLTDAIRAVRPHMPPQPAPGDYTFWDYQGGAWERGDGIRIDHLLLSPQAADILTDAQIDTATRNGPKPSDHVPVWVALDA
jgi:exodeoxyribonuclease-3